MEKAKKLRQRAKELRELDEDKLAKRLEKRADQLEKKSKEEVPQQVVMYSEGDRLFVRPPFPGFTRVRALSINLKQAAGEDGDGNPNYKWEGQSYKKDDPRRGLWSFKEDQTIRNRVLKVLGDFFSKAPIVDADGQQVGELPESTYQAD